MASLLMSLRNTNLCRQNKYLQRVVDIHQGECLDKKIDETCHYVLPYMFGALTVHFYALRQ